MAFRSPADRRGLRLVVAALDAVHEPGCVVVPHPVGPLGLEVLVARRPKGADDRHGEEQHGSAATTPAVSSSRRQPGAAVSGLTNRAAFTGPSRWRRRRPWRLLHASPAGQRRETVKKSR